MIIVSVYTHIKLCVGDFAEALNISSITLNAPYFIKLYISLPVCLNSQINPPAYHMISPMYITSDYAVLQVHKCTSIYRTVLCTKADH